MKMYVVGVKNDGFFSRVKTGQNWSAESHRRHFVIAPVPPVFSIPALWCNPHMDQPRNQTNSAAWTTTSSTPGPPLCQTPGPSALPRLCAGTPGSAAPQPKYRTSGGQPTNQPDQQAGQAKDTAIGTGCAMGINPEEEKIFIDSPTSTDSLHSGHSQTRKQLEGPLHHK